VTDPVPSPRKIAVLTVGRSDFGRYRPVLTALATYENVSVSVLASGNHFDPRFGNTIEEIKDSGFSWVDGLGLEAYSDNRNSVGLVIAEGTQKLTRYFESETPDLLVLLGDRFEMLSGGAAAIGFGIPLAHLHGGAVTEGAIDELVRHALTKMSHVHMVSCDIYGARLAQMGEEAWRIHVTGAPGLDELPALSDMKRKDMSDEVGLDLTGSYILACLHPETISHIPVGEQVSRFLSALDALELPMILTYPNADQGNATVVDKFEAFAKENASRVRLLKNAGTRLFINLVANAAGMVGNSSSGIVEAPSVKTPVVNIGNRQTGKVKAKNVIDVPFNTDAIIEAIKNCVSASFRDSLNGLINPYGDGHAGERIAEILATLPVDQRLLHKRFVDE